ncbi:MAG TPA: AAA family ATPase [Chloroflexota bacterium]|nr:AAA family ATPase [Chloroflexota bacterium]
MADSSEAVALLPFLERRCRCGAAILETHSDRYICARGHTITKAEAAKLWGVPASDSQPQGVNPDGGTSAPGGEGPSPKGNSNGTYRDDAVAVEPVYFKGLPRPKPRCWVVAQFVPEGLPAMLYGAGGSTKSMVALTMGVCVAEGMPWLGREVSKRPVAYLDFEFDQQEQHIRALAVTKGLDLEDVPEDFAYFPCVGHTMEQVQSKVEEWLDSNPGGLLIIDSYGMASTGDAKDEEPVIAFMRGLRSIGAGGLLIIDHEAKVQVGQDRKHKTAYGSVYKENLCRMVWHAVLEGSKDGKAMVTLLHHKTNMGPKSEPIQLEVVFLEDEDGSLDMVQMVEANPAAWPIEESANLQKRVADALRKQGPTTVTAIAATLNKNRGSVKTEVNRLQRQGVVQSIGKQGREFIYAPVGNSNQDNPMGTVTVTDSSEPEGLYYDDEVEEEQQQD